MAKKTVSTANPLNGVATSKEAKRPEKRSVPAFYQEGHFAKFLERELNSSLGMKFGRRDLFREFVFWALATLQEDEEAAKEYEARYPDAAVEYPRWFETLKAEVRGNPCRDALGTAYMLLEANNKASGQHFTPWHVAYVMAAITVGNVQYEDRLEHGMEPCSGSGVMVLAAEWHRRENGMNPIIWTVIDLDPLCAAMAAVQFGLNDIAALVLSGNSLFWGVPGHEEMRLVSPRIRYETPEGLKDLNHVTQGQAARLADHLEAKALEALRLRKAAEVTEKAG